MGSDWIWELRVPAAAGPALRQVYALAAERDLRPQRPDGLINLFAESAAGLRTVEDPDTALAAMATGTQHGQFWTDGDTDIFVSWKDGRLVWVLDACFCYRRAVPEAAAFRELHGRLTGLWLDVAQRLDADVGRVDDPAAVDPLAYEDIHRRWLR